MLVEIKIEKFLNEKKMVQQRSVTRRKKEALEKLKKTKVLTTDILEPLGISFESFLKLAQLSSKQVKDITAKLIKNIEKE